MSDTLRIGYVVRMFPRFSETFVLQEILELERQGADVTIFSMLKPNEGRFHPALSSLRARVIYLDEREAKRWWTWLPEEWPALASDRERLWTLVEEVSLRGNGSELDMVFWGALLAAKARTLALDTLHAHFASAAATLAYYAHRISGIGYSFTAHAKDIFTESIDRDFLTTKINAARFIVTVSEFNRRFLIEEHPGVSADRIRVLYNGINREFFSPINATPREQPALILSIGRLVAKKGFADLIRACGELRRRNLHFRCLIVGQGREEAALRELVSALGLDGWVGFAGARHQEEVRDLMRLATVLCLPCRRDSDGNQDALPTVLLEAMACGLPVISTRLSGIPEIIDDGADGLLVDPESPTQVADALESLLNADDRWTQLREGGLRKVAARFDIQRNVSVLHGWLKERAGERGRSIPAGAEAQVPPQRGRS